MYVLEPSGQVGGPRGVSARVVPSGIAMVVQRLVQTTVVVLVAAGCAREQVPEPRHAFELAVSATTDEGLPVREAEIWIDSERVGSTDAKGALISRATLFDGTEFRIDTRCPVGYHQAGSSKTVRALRVAGLAAGTPQILPVRVECTPTHRKAAVVVRVKPAAAPSRKPAGRSAAAPEWLQLPILLDGQVVGETGADGLAHLLFDVRDESSFRLILDTSAYPRLQPQNPVTMLAMKHADERFVIDQGFSERPLPKKRARKKKKAAPPPVSRPQELKSLDARR